MPADWSFAAGIAVNSFEVLGPGPETARGAAAPPNQ